MARSQLCLLALAALCCTMVGTSTPPYMKVCGRHDPSISECVKQSVIQMVLKLRDGIPELDVPSIEPLDVDEVALSNIADFKAVATNIKLRGISNVVIKYFKVDLKKGRIDLEALFPEVLMSSDFDVQAKILVPINENGPIDIKTENVEIKAVLYLKTVKHRGRALLYFPTMNCKLVLKDYTANFKPGANNPLVEAINAVMVSSSKEIIESMTPNFEKALSTKILDVANRISKHFTYDELFPDRV